MPRSIWNGDISFGMVSIPVSLVSIEENNDIHFHLLDSKTRARVRYQRVNEETGKEVPWKDIVKGYEYDKDSFIVVDEKEFEKASPALFKTIDIEEFVDLNDIDSLYFTKPYYLVPDSKNKKAYVLLREALKKTDKVGVAKVIIRTKESLSLILAHDHALLLYLIHFKDELRDEEELNLPREALSQYKVTEKEVKMATELIKDMTAKWKPEKYHNDYREALQKWLDQQMKKQAKSGKKVTQKVKSSDAVVDFISLLKDSMKNKKEATPKRKT
ncbi:Ku protein [Legionella shakespearei]|uniref:Non-homologous end joining protein Ku n=1 Tax=Legionella shakespearei DSM 23087 TaxID=1122169 RepID=A0A0W0YMM1_9GAMM|nr:Ku protein [Legionella shakespearei]KTD58154.1 putative DNA repair protein YkoV [Legionella shakespearei DSM 23087]